MVKDDSEFDAVLSAEDGGASAEDGVKRFEAPEGIWMRGLMMLILALMFGLAETVLAVVAVVQFLWMMFAGEKNALLMGFGEDLAKWLAAVALFQSGATEDKPFPWAKWG